MSSILNDTKKILGLDSEYTVFDLDVITHLNAAFAVVNQLGVGPEAGFFIEDGDDQWSSLGLETRVLNVVKTYVYLKTRMLFDPPTTSFMIDAANNQLKEYEWRLNVFREVEVDPL